MGGQIIWDDEGREHLRSRSERYPGAVDIEPEWTQEAMDDPYAIVLDPDPKASAPNVVRVIGHSEAAGFVITLIAYRERSGDVFGASAWKSSGRELREYSDRRPE